jgi:hypothetical protein
VTGRAPLKTPDADGVGPLLRGAYGAEPPTAVEPPIIMLMLQLSRLSDRDDRLAEAPQPAPDRLSLLALLVSKVTRRKARDTEQGPT